MRELDRCIRLEGDVKASVQDGLSSHICDLVTATSILLVRDRVLCPIRDSKYMITLDEVDE